MALYRAYLGFIIMVKLNHKQGLVSRKGKITRNLGRITKNTAKNTNKNKTRQGQIKKKKRHRNVHDIFIHFETISNKLYQLCI